MMLDQLIQLDQDIFLIINQRLSNSLFDCVMPILRNRYFWIPLYMFLAFIMLKKYGKRGAVILLFFVISFGLSDFLTASIIKPNVARLRPCNDPLFNTQVRNLIPCGSGYSFPSSHAANHFAMGVFLIILFYKKWKWIIPLALLWAFSISFAQIYVGVHYPIDVTTGALIGCIIGYIAGISLQKIMPPKTWKIGN